jgi:hypothetical protein
MTSKDDALVESARRARDWAVAENDHIEPELVAELADALEAQAARVNDLQTDVRHHKTCLDAAVKINDESMDRIATLEAQLASFREAAKPFSLFAKSLLEWRAPMGLVQSEWPEHKPVLDRSHPVEGAMGLIQRRRIFKSDFEKLAALDAAAAVDGDAQWNAAIEAAAKVADRLVGEWHSDLADACAKQAASDIRALKRG